LQGSLQKSSSSTQEPQASEGNVPRETDRRSYYKTEHHFSEDVESNKDIRIVPLGEDISLLDYSLY
jgi:hypothetical protein